MRRDWECLQGLLAILAIGASVLVAGCSNIARTPETIRNVKHDQFGEQHPLCFQDRNCKAPKAFLVKSEAAWTTLWGPGETPPVVNFEREMVFIAFTSLSSEGPGTMEVWVQKFVAKEDVIEVRVREVVSGSWPLSAAYSRAYHMVRLPKSDLPVKVTWRYLWGNRDETKELRAEEWLPGAPATGTGAAGFPNQSGQQQQLTGGYHTWGPQQR